MHRGRLLWAVLAALVLWGGWNQRQVNRLEREVDELRAAAQDAATNASPSVAATNPDPGLERIASELSALRGDVAALRKRLEERLPSSERGVVSAAQTAEAERRSVGSVGKSVPGYLRSGFVDRSGLPEAVLEGFRQQLGEVPIEGAHFKQSEGRLY